MQVYEWKERITANSFVNLILIWFLFHFTALTCTLGKIHLVGSSLFLLALRSALSLLQILSSRNMTFLSSNLSCQCVRYHLICT
jgi:hypothetical protein